MNTMLSKTVFILCVLLLGLHLRADDKIAVTIVPEQSEVGPDGTYQAKINYYHSFGVVIANKSSDPVRVWEDWNSWGYYNLTFDVKLANGKVYHLKKKLVDFTMNFSSHYLIKPSSYYVIYVSFDKEWDAFPKKLIDELKKNKEVLLKAIYTIPNDKDKDAEKNKIWTGTVESEWLRVALSWPEEQAASDKSK